jgi:hypothetical protein
MTEFFLCDTETVLIKPKFQYKFTSAENEIGDLVENRELENACEEKNIIITRFQFYLTMITCNQTTRGSSFTISKVCFMGLTYNRRS